MQAQQIQAAQMLQTQRYLFRHWLALIIYKLLYRIFRYMAMQNQIPAMRQPISNNQQQLQSILMQHHQQQAQQQQRFVQIKNIDSQLMNIQYVTNYWIF